MKGLSLLQNEGLSRWVLSVELKETHLADWEKVTNTLLSGRRQESGELTALPLYPGQARELLLGWSSGFQWPS